MYSVRINLVLQFIVTLIVTQEDAMNLGRENEIVEFKETSGEINEAVIVIVHILYIFYKNNCYLVDYIVTMVTNNFRHVNLLEKVVKKVVNCN